MLEKAADTPVSDEPATSRSTRVYQSVVDKLRYRIECGVWVAGERLPSIAQLARELEVGTGSVREALRALQSLGMVQIRHGSGVFVAGTPPADDLSPHFHSRGIGMLVALAETRRLLEPELAALAAERGSEADLVEIERLAILMEEEARQGVDFVEPDVAFHRLIAQAARNPILYRMLESVNDLFLESRRLTAREPGMTARAVRYHRLIAEALRDRDAGQARLLMLAHMNDALSSVLAAEARPRTT